MPGNTSPQARPRREQPANQANRNTTYNVYDNYLDTDQRDESNRNSGINALGMGLLNGDMDDSDDDSEDERPARPIETRAPTTPTTPNQPLQRTLTPTTPTTPRTPTSPTNIVAPKPGYSISPLRLAQPIPSAAPDGRRPADTLRINVPSPNTPLSRAPSVPSTPHPLGAPVTPITPVFARPAKASSPSSTAVSFSEKSDRHIMRGNSEDSLLPKRGDKGDDFWRRFSMVIKDDQKLPSGNKKSTWLHKTQSNSSSLSRWVWCIGLFFVIVIAGASGLGWYLTHNKPSHQDPLTFGGRGNNQADGQTAAPLSTALAGKVASTHRVTPTNTVARRDGEPEVFATAVPKSRRHYNRAAHL